MFCNLLGEQLGQGCIVSSLEPLSPPALKKHPPPPPWLDDSWKIRWKKAVVVSPRVGQPALSGRTFNPDTCIEPPPDKIWIKTWSDLQKPSNRSNNLNLFATKAKHTDWMGQTRSSVHQILHKKKQIFPTGSRLTQNLVVGPRILCLGPRL